MTTNTDRALAEELRETARVLGMPSLLPAAALLDAQAKELDERRKYIAQLEQQLLDRIDPLRDLPR